jgi:Phosphoinositide phospholipase C, Ca2+-dependent
MSDVNSLQYYQVSMKGAHNSFQRDETLVEQIQFDAKKPYNGGCRALELDISQSDKGNRWSVGHSAGYSTTYRQLSQFLAELRAYNRAHPGHDVVTLYLDLKSVQKGFPDELDDYVRSFLDSPMYTPGELMGGAPNLSMGAKQNGWPTLEKLKGRFIVVLTGKEEAKSKYALTDPARRLCFADKDRDADVAPVSRTRVFFNYHLYSSEKDKWCKTFREAAGRPNTIIRGYVLNGEKLWDNALACGCHVLATDKVSGSSWATVGEGPFTELKPLAAAAPATAAV